MTFQKKVLKQQQIIARAEQQLAVEKLKKRRADTRNKIQFDTSIPIGFYFIVSLVLLKRIRKEDRI